MLFAKNPYLNRTMIRSTESFYGRRSEVARVAQRLAAESPQSVAVIGDRRAGKSSFLHYISRPEIAAQYLEDPDATVFLSLDFQEQRRLTVEGFIVSVFKHLQAALGERYEITQAPDYDGLTSVLDDLGADFRLILLFDEFDRVTRSSSFDEGFFGYLRSLAGRYNIAFVTSTTRDLQQLCHTDEIAASPFFNIFSSVKVGPFQPQEARQLIIHPSAATPFPLEEHYDLLIELGGFLPFFLQIACSAAFEVLLEEGEAAPAKVSARFLEEAEPHFQFYWQHMDAVSKSLCNDLASSRDSDPSRSEYQDLVRRGMVRKDGNGLFSAPFSEFVRRHYALEVGDEPLEVQASRLRSMEEELETARQMQMSLLPHETPVGRGVEVVGRVVPATHVGGDFFQYLWLGELGNQLAIVAVDVMGHGMQSALTALRFSETLRYEARGRTSPGDILEALNRALCETLEKGAFVGCCIGVIDLQDRWVEIGTGGYHPPLHYSRNRDEVWQPELGNLPLGIKRNTTYDCSGFSFEEGDALLFYSDGVIEAADDRQVVYGEDRLGDVLLAAARENLSAHAIIERLLWDLGRFTASSGQDDDITAIAIRLGDF